MVTLPCAWVEDSNQCSELSELRNENIPLCKIHKSTLSNYYTRRASRHIASLYNQGHLTKHSKGHTYIILLPNGNIKIGYSAVPEHGLYDRWRNISREYGHHVKVISVIEGGRTMEALLHVKFDHLRVLDQLGEQFSPSAELIAFAIAQGTKHEISQIERFDRWSPKQWAWREAA